MFRRTLTALLLLATIAAAAPTARAQVVAGPFNYTVNNHNYYLVRIANYADYAAAAANLGGYPVVINTAAENEFLHQHVIPSIPSPFDYAYIGYTNVNPVGDYHWVAGVIDTFTHWNAGEPNNSGGTEHYASMRLDGTWNDIGHTPADNGNGLAVGIVEVNLATSAPTGILYGPIAAPDTGHVYYITTPGTWWAQEIFAESVLNGRLASINTPAETKFLTQNILQLPNIGSSLTIGLNASQTSPAAFNFWTDGYAVNAYTHWATGQPTNLLTNWSGAIYTTGTNAGLWFSTTDVSRGALLEVNRCPGDFNKSGSVEIQDIFDFLNAWFAACP